MLVRSVVLLRAAAAFGLALGLPLVAVAQERGRLFFDPDHLGIERGVPKAYSVRLLPPPTGNVVWKSASPSVRKWWKRARARCCTRPTRRTCPSGTK